MTPNALERQIRAVFPSISHILFETLIERLKTLSGSIEESGVPVDPAILSSAEFYLVMLCSPFAADHFTRCPQDLSGFSKSLDLEKRYSEHTLSHKLNRLLDGAGADDPISFRKKLVDFKLYEVVRIAWRDLTGRADLDETMADLSHLAQACISAAFDFLYKSLCRQWGTPVDANGNFQQIVVLGMGKLGAWELNFSSDIDLIFAYLEDGYTTGESPISNHEFFTKLCRAFLKMFTAKEGVHFYRVDARLRPYGDSGPLVMSCAALEDYYQAQGREWERYALIKARPVAGDLAAGEAVLKCLNSFIYRRYLDYNSFDSFRDMKQRIAQQVKSAQLKHNIKLGAGGIREVEFFGQLFQLIRGGVEPVLQERPILKVLDLLVASGCIDGKTCKDLTSAYCFLRKVENRLQEYEDRQTHDIPQDPEMREVLALAMGYETFEVFFEALSGVQTLVHSHFSQLLVGASDTEDDGRSRDLSRIWDNINAPQFITDAVSIPGFEDPERVVSILKNLAAHPSTQRLTPSGRKKLNRLVPRLVKAAGRAEDAETVLIQLVDLIITIERRTCYLSLLIENKGALETLVTLASKSAWIITFLSRHPALLDELMHPATLYAPPKREDLEREMDRRMERVPPGELEFLLEELNIFCQVNTLRVAAADVSGNYPLMKVSDHLTYIAETILAQVLTSSWRIVTEKYGLPEGLLSDAVEGSGFLILAYGKVGGLEMGYKSDLDLVFLFRADSGYTRGAQRSIETIRFYGNLGQRIIHALTVHTSAGTLYGADMRLRPGGDSGTIVSHIDGFKEYLFDQAWTWEHQALIRARAVAGDPELIKEFNDIRGEVLTLKRDPETLKKEVAEMRERMRAQRLKTEPGIFDLKQSPGGIVDIEFLVQYLALKHAHDYPDVIVWTDNIRLIEGLSVEGLVSAEESQILQEAYVTMRQVMHRLTLQEKPARVDEALFMDRAREVAAVYDTHLAL